MSLRNFSNGQFLDWIKNNVRGTSEQKDAVIASMRTAGMEGDDLIAVQAYTEFSEYGVTAMMARRLFNKLKESYPNEFGTGNNNNANQDERVSQTNQSIEDIIQQNEAARAEQARNTNNNGNSTTQHSNSDSFQVSIYVGNKRKLTKNKFTVNSTVYSLKQEIVRNESGGNASDIRLQYNRKPLKDDKTLGYYGITNSNCFVSKIVRLNGGASAQNEKKQETKENENKILDNGKNSDTRIRYPRFKENKNITPTFEKDCVTLEDSRQELRVKMPCGHVFSPLTIFKWSQRILEVYSKAEVCCPMLKCNKKWEVDDIASGADLDASEKSSLISILNHRKLMEDGDFKQCPECESLVELPDTVYLCRVRCTSQACKNKKDFCWLCNKSWQGPGLAVCGNKECHSAFVNDQLKIENCGTTDKIWGHTDVKVPTRRACPRCLSICEYKENCKHMVCFNCKRSFCFVCLALAGKEVNGYGYEWACAKGDSASLRCELAPVQVLT